MYLTSPLSLSFPQCDITYDALSLTAQDVQHSPNLPHLPLDIPIAAEPAHILQNICQSALDHRNDAAQVRSCIWILRVQEVGCAAFPCDCPRVDRVERWDLGERKRYLWFSLCHLSPRNSKKRTRCRRVSRIACVNGLLCPGARGST